MSSAPIRIHLHIGDYMRDTEELSLTQHGAYIKLMLWYYSTARGIPNDLDRACRRVRATSAEERGAVEFVLCEFFKLSTDRTVFIHKRIEQELDTWRARTEKAELSAQARWNKKVNEINETDNANAMPTQCDGIASRIPYPVSRIPKDQTLLSFPSESDIAACREILKFLKKLTGRSYREVPSNIKFIRAVLKTTPMDDVKLTLAYMRDKWGDNPKMEQYLRITTLFRASNWEQYLAEAKAAEEQA